MGFLWVTGFSFSHCVASPFHSFVTTFYLGTEVHKLRACEFAAVYNLMGVTMSGLPILPRRRSSLESLFGIPIMHRDSFTVHA